MRGDLRAIFPVVAQLADEVKRPSNNDGIVRSSPVERIFESGFRLLDDRKVRGVVRGDFRKLRAGNGARGARLRENHFGGRRKKNTGNFIDGFVAQRAEHQPNFAAGKVLFQESGQLSRSGRVVRAIKVNVRLRLQLFETPGPNGFADSPRNRVIRNAVAAVLKIARGG